MLLNIDTMAVLEVTHAYTMERNRSASYIRHAESLLSLAEKELISDDGHMISLKGLRKLKDKVVRIKS